uniref:HTH CENPB-type domain-containing protein n=1 Tax=Trichogramma kaykai TaxID=54128 RepID=A0ABD2WEJ4_9HYME
MGRVNKTLSVTEKYRILKVLENKNKKDFKNVAKENNLALSTLYSIIQRKNDILSRVESGDTARIRNRGAGYPAVDEALLQWLKHQPENSDTISGPILQEKAKSFANELGLHKFQASNGWLDKFKARHGIVLKKLCGDSASVKNSQYNEWHRSLSDIVKNYLPEDVFNADELGLFFKCLPDYILTLENEDCHGGQRSKERITVLLACNSTGTEKLTPLVIGKAVKPRCFRGIKTLPLEYASNNKAWMTTTLFSDWLLKLNAQMRFKKRNILMFIDSCAAHGVLPELSNVKIQFLPRCATSTLQPFDQGVFKTFKYLYRREIVRKTMEEIKENEKPSSIDLIHAIRMIDKSWKNIPLKTIRNCFKSCGFKFFDEIPDLSYAIDIETITRENNELNYLLQTNVKFENFINFDGNLFICDQSFDSEIITSEDENSDQQSDEEDERNLSVQINTSREVRKAIDCLKNFFEMNTCADENIFSKILEIENVADQIIVKNKYK